MKNPHATSDQPLSILTVADLEALIVKIVQKVVNQQTQNLKQQDLQIEITQATHHKLF